MQVVVLGQEDWLQLLLLHSQPRPCLCVCGEGAPTPTLTILSMIFFLSHQSWDFKQNDMRNEHAYLWRRKKRWGKERKRSQTWWVWLTGYELSFFISNFSGQFHLRGLDSIMGWPQFTFQKSPKLNVILSGKINNELSNLVQRSTNWYRKPFNVTLYIYILRPNLTDKFSTYGPWYIANKSPGRDTSSINSVAGNASLYF